MTDPPIVLEIVGSAAGLEDEREAEGKATPELDDRQASEQRSHFPQRPGLPEGESAVGVRHRAEAQHRGEQAEEEGSQPRGADVDDHRAETGHPPHLGQHQPGVSRRKVVEEEGRERPVEGTWGEGEVAGSRRHPPHPVIEAPAHQEVTDLGVETGHLELDAPSPGPGPQHRWYLPAPGAEVEERLAAGPSVEPGEDGTGHRTQAQGPPQHPVQVSQGMLGLVPGEGGVIQQLGQEVAAVRVGPARHRGSD
jgi:hypothetical protein